MENQICVKIFEDEKGGEGVRPPCKAQLENTLELDPPPLPQVKWVDLPLLPLPLCNIYT